MTLEVYSFNEDGSGHKFDSSDMQTETENFSFVRHKRTSKFPIFKTTANFNITLMHNHFYSIICKLRSQLFNKVMYIRLRVFLHSFEA